VLAGGPLWAWPAALLVRSRLAGALAGRLGVAAAIGDTLLGLNLDPPMRWSVEDWVIRKRAL